MNIELVLLLGAKALIELAGFFLFGQAILYLLAGEGRDRNFFYQIFVILTRPLIRGVRIITPSVIVDRHIPYVTFIILCWAWLMVVFWVLPEMCASGSVNCENLLDRKRDH